MLRTPNEIQRDLGRVLRRKVTIQKKVTERDQYGNIKTRWEDWKTVWAERESLFGRDYFAALAVGEEQTLQFVVRYARFLEEMHTDTHRLVYEDEIYNIRQIDYMRDDGMWMKIRAIRGG